MTVQDLIAALQKMPGEAPVAVALYREETGPSFGYTPKLVTKTAKFDPNYDCYDFRPDGEISVVLIS